MADFVKTITNRLNLFGADYPNKWGTMLWGQNWGYGDGELIQVVYKNVSEGVSLSDAVFPAATFNLTIVNSMGISGDMAFEGLYDRNGYNIIFVSSANAESRSLTSYTTNSISDVVTFTTVAITTTTWTLV